MDGTRDVNSRVDHALRQAAARAYEAAHGALGDDSDDAEPPRWRWEVSPRVIVTLGVVAAIIGTLVVWAPRTEGAVGSAPLAVGEESQTPSAVSGALVSVHVAGAVQKPGVYQLAFGSRVTDAIEAAGGPVEGAQLESINLARQVVDGEQVRLPTQEEASASAGTAVDGRININSATASQLEDLPGVGPVLAGRIVAYREHHGQFASVEALESVTGVGPAIVAGLADAAAV